MGGFLDHGLKTDCLFFDLHKCLKAIQGHLCCFPGDRLWDNPAPWIVPS